MYTSERGQEKHEVSKNEKSGSVGQRRHLGLVH